MSDRRAWRRVRGARRLGLGLLLVVGASGAASGARAAPRGAPEVELVGPRTRAPSQPFPTTLRLELPYARSWDAVVAVLASRGFPLEVVARDSGIVGTGWRITQPNHLVRIGKKDFVGRKAERLTVLVRPLPRGAQISITGQSALVSPQWSAAGMPPAGQAADIPGDTVTEYGLLYDIASVLGLSLRRAPDPAYGLALARTGVFEKPPATSQPADPVRPDALPSAVAPAVAPAVRRAPAAEGHALPLPPPRPPPVGAGR